VKIAFLAPIYATVPYRGNYSSIIDYLAKQGHSVNHLLSITQQALASYNQENKDKLILNFHKNIRQCDLAIAECSIPSINVGYEISLAIHHEKEVIILKSIEPETAVTSSNLLCPDKNAYIYEYNKTNLISTLKEALQFIAPKKHKKFNLLFTPAMTDRLNYISRKKNLPKSVYIRQLIEENLALEELE
jgi:hypothetical protein